MLYLTSLPARTDLRSSPAARIAALSRNGSRLEIRRRLHPRGIEAGPCEHVAEVRDVAPDLFAGTSRKPLALGREQLFLRPPLRSLELAAQRDAVVALEALVQREQQRTAYVGCTCQLHLRHRPAGRRPLTRELRIQVEPLALDHRPCATALPGETVATSSRCRSARAASSSDDAAI